MCSTNDCTQEQIKICMVTKSKRVSKNEYIWSGSTVFPGGLLHSGSDGQFVDICRKYYSLWFDKYGFSFDDVMYRVNGLRELFEETGMLLCRSKESICRMIEQKKISYPIKASVFKQSDDVKLDVTEWRHKVMNDPYQFQRLFECINMLPDILSLVPWGRILTPWFVSSKRWDARFYLTLIEQKNVDIVINGNQMINALGKEIIRIDWLNINDAVGPKKIKKYKSIPFITSIQLQELYQIIHIESCLLKEWRNAYFDRDICIFRPKMVVRFPGNDIITLFPGDYLYHKIVDDSDVACDAEKENNPKFLQRIMTNKKAGTQLYKVLSEQNRLYSYRKGVSSKL